MSFQADTLPQADASSLVDRELLEAQVKEMYRRVAREQEAELHFALGRPLALRLGYPRELLDALPDEALASFAVSATTPTSPRPPPADACRALAPGPARTASSP